MKILLRLMFFLLGITLVNAQNTYKVYGTVIDFHNKTLLSNARIKMGNFVALSDEEGKFVFSAVNKGNYTLTAEHPDCEMHTEDINVDRNIEITINLEHHIEELETVTITALRKPSGNIVIKTLDNEAITKNSTENLGNILSGISGVGTLKTGNNISKPIIHGLYGSRVSIINSGVKMAEQEWGVEHAPSIETTAFERINVVKGSGVLKFGGDAVGGVVLLEPKNFAAKDTLMGDVSLSGISNGRGAKIGVNLAQTWENRWFVKTGATYKKLGDLYIPKHTLQNTGTEEQSLNFSFGKRSFVQGFTASYSGIFQNFGIFKGSHLGGPEDFYNVITYGQKAYLDDFSYHILSPRQEVSHHIAKLEAYKRFYSFGKLTAQYSFQLNNRKEYDIRRGEHSDLASMDLRLMTQNLKIEHLLERENWQIESGIFGAVQDNFPNPATKARRLIPDYYRYDAGAFSVFQYRFNRKLKGEIGARYDFNRYDAYKYYDESDWERRFENLFPQFEVTESGARVLTRPILDYHNFSANAGLNFKPTEQTDFKLNFSRTSRTPNAAELFADGLHHSAAIIETGSLAIKKEEVYHANFLAAAKLNVLSGLEIEVNPYLMISDNFINQIPTGVQNSNRGVFMIWDFVQTKARIFGVDADLQLNFTNNLKWNSQFSTLRGDDLGNSEPLILMMPTNFKNALELNLNQLKNFYLKVENETALKQNRYPIRNINLTMIENGETVIRELDTSSTPEGYSVFHAAFGMDLAKNLNVNFRINNIFNTEYREYLNRLRYFAPELGRSLILTFKYNF